MPLRHSSSSPENPASRAFPGAPAFCRRHIACDDFFAKNHRALILLLHLGLSAAACAAVGLETRLRAQSFTPIFRSRKLSRGPRRPGGRSMDFAPFKKPGLLTGLFSYRSVIPPSPHKTLLRKFSQGPWSPCRAAAHCAPFRKPGRLAGLSLSFSFRSSTSLAARTFPGENAHGSTVLLAHLCRHSQLRGAAFV